MKIEYGVWDPNGNITILVKTLVAAGDQPALAARLMEIEPEAEQVGFLSEELPSEAFAEPPAGRRGSGREIVCDAALRMAGGEFCGNASLCAAAAAALQRERYAGRMAGEDCLANRKEETGPGPVYDMLLRVSGAEAPVSVKISRICDAAGEAGSAGGGVQGGSAPAGRSGGGEQASGSPAGRSRDGELGGSAVWAGEVEMPRADRIEYVSLPLAAGPACADAQAGGKMTVLPVVHFPGISHVILEEEMSREQAETCAPLWCRLLGADALGLMFLDPDRGRLIPLVYVPAAGTLFWENSCASGTTAVGIYLSAGKTAPEGQVERWQPLHLCLRQPGGMLEIRITEDGRPVLKGSARLVREESIQLQDPPRKPALFWLAAGIGGLAGALLLQIAARHVPGFADGWAHRVYPVLVRLLGGFWGNFPFSAAEVLLYAFIALWGIIFAAALIRIVRKKRQAVQKMGIRLLAFAATCCVLFFVYEANCGVNYYAASFSELAGLEKEAYGEEELEQVCRLLTEELCDAGSRISGDSLQAGRAVWEKEAAAAMEALGRDYPVLAMEYPRPKAVHFSRILSVQGVTGVYSPFTIEANYNAQMPSYNIPFTMCHELSHLNGLMREDEANFIAWLACRGSRDAAFRYSGAMLGWISCTNELARFNADTVRTLSAMLPEEVREELRANTAFWKQYESKTSQVHEQVNDAYLKSRGQREGTKTYDRVVGLIVSWYRGSGRLK